jgi:hypothetical protein
MAKQLLRVSLWYARSTKGTHRYDTQRPEDQKLLTCLYLNKGALPEPHPDKIELVLEVIE